jgi:hypothetical protein
MSFSAIVSEGRNSIRHGISCPFRLEFSNEDFFCCVLKISGAKWQTMMVDDRSFCVALASAWCLWRDLYYFSSGLYRGTSHEIHLLCELWGCMRLAHRFAFLYAARSQQCHDWFTATHKRGWVAGWGSLFFYTGLLFHPVAFPSVQSVRWSTLHNVYSLCRFRWPRAPPHRGSIVLFWSAAPALFKSILSPPYLMMANTVRELLHASPPHMRHKSSS